MPHPSSTPKPTSQPTYATRFHIYTYVYIHRVSPPSGVPPAAAPALGAATGLDPLITSLDPALEASFLFGLLQTRALKALQALPTYHPYEAAPCPCVRRPMRRAALPGYPPPPQGLLRVESAKTHVLEGGLLPSILASAAMPVPLVRSLVITPPSSPPRTRTSSDTQMRTLTLNR